MHLLFALPLLLLLLHSLFSSWALAVRPSSGHVPQKACPSCADPPGSSRAPREQAGEDSTVALAADEPCGVYTLSCARGLRCVPPPREGSPLQALLQGRGVCARGAPTGSTKRPLPTALDPSYNSDLEKAPCRKLQNTILQGLELTVFQSSHDIYIPNCDTRGFYMKKQCQSSRRMQRGHCWCVSEDGTPLPSRIAEDGTVHCN
ncbi:insulin-like growth factor-binding protein 3 [Megalops cyprinoides]|uniref:insulin-like growth factor-binding protein 3 n=1 Tax=Megalops cyprinoides TaxID=118141 RepID=UPI001864F6F1|nr:insulin-like growth factor-binding protein 3 [Megalops cyprinoides]